MKDKKDTTKMLFAGRIANQIAELVRLRDNFIERLVELGDDPNTAQDAVERIYEAAWNYVEGNSVE